MTDALPIDPLMMNRWTNQWMEQLGFNDEQLAKRNNKVEQFSQVCISCFSRKFVKSIELFSYVKFVLDRIKAKKLADIEKREQLLIETLRDYEHRLSRTGFENDIDVS